MYLNRICGLFDCIGGFDMTQEKRVALAVEAMERYAEQAKASKAKTREALHATGAYTLKGTLRRSASANTGS